MFRRSRDLDSDSKATQLCPALTAEGRASALVAQWKDGGLFGKRALSRRDRGGDDDRAEVKSQLAWIVLLMRR